MTSGSGRRPHPDAGPAPVAEFVERLLSAALLAFWGAFAGFLAGGHCGPDLVEWAFTRAAALGLDAVAQGNADALLEKASLALSARLGLRAECDRPFVLAASGAWAGAFAGLLLAAWVAGRAPSRRWPLEPGPPAR